MNKAPTYLVRSEKTSLQVDYLSRLVTFLFTHKIRLVYLNFHLVFSPGLETVKLTLTKPWLYRQVCTTCNCWRTKEQNDTGSVLYYYFIYHVLAVL